MTTAIFIPTFGRADQISSVYENCLESTDEPIKIYFILEKKDILSIAVCEMLKYNFIINTGAPKYSACINTAFKQTDEPLFFCAADDLDFQKDWLKIAKSKLSDQIRVVGTNDLLNNFVALGVHATHFLVKRSYIDKQTGTIDQSFPVLYEYDHNYTDTEFIGTARFRNAFAPCLESVVKHVHANRDETTEKTLRNASLDAQLYHSRKHLWREIYPF